jgi:hypothetical protein
MGSVGDVARRNETIDTRNGRKLDASSEKEGEEIETEQVRGRRGGKEEAQK